ncbi:MAG: hypothetical protein BAJALOKI3v1_190009 [Promethearchaeota archaeon]|jgi:hypothetical protein|nr:MAG: hypothetical protein BAJALOKI3v1_190009 [Candidatus Lokiarchaeota archaeon]
MEIFSKIKNIFGKTSIESLKELETEIINLQDKLNNGWVTIFGYGGRLKGLPLIYKVEDEKKIKRFSAKIIESISALNSVIESQDLENFNIHYTENILHFRKVNKEIGIMGYLGYGSDINKLKEWIGDNLTKVKKLFQD